MWKLVDCGSYPWFVREIHEIVKIETSLKKLKSKSIDQAPIINNKKVIGIFV